MDSYRKLYTRSGADHLTEQGVPRERITVVHNSVDTNSLRRKMAEIQRSEIGEFRQSNHLHSPNIAMFVGALDPSKRLDLLLAASQLIRRRIPDFRLIVAGEGPLRSYLEQAATLQSEVCLLPYADMRDLALIGSVSKVCMMPGRVGLVAVDAMTLGVPVITTDWLYHAPERDYLTPDFCITTSQTSQGLADAAISMLLDGPGRDAASIAAKEASLSFSIENSAQQVYGAIASLLHT